MSAYATDWRDAAQGHGRVRTWLRSAVLHAAAATRKRLDERFLRCLYCHYVFDNQREDFARLIARLKQIGRFVDTDTCAQMITGEREIDGRYFHLSFDDGLRNHYTNALPILAEHDVPAIFFVPSALIGAEPDAQRKYCLETTRYRSVVELLTWDDLGAMVARGYEVGSHTQTHARFADLSSDPLAMASEIAGSKGQIEAKLGVACPYISWPYGTIADVDAAALEVVAQAGYRACFGAYRGSVKPGAAVDPYKVPRHQFEPQWPLAHVEYFARGNMEAG